VKRNNIINKCRDLRKNSTDAENNLWKRLRNRELSGVKFKRQFPIGKYILDFYSAEYKLCIEADGGQHYIDEYRQRDEVRTSDLNTLGIEVLRFSDYEILTNIESVCEVILKIIDDKRNIPSP
jgi:very-short-patch-repair endonuclease